MNKLLLRIGGIANIMVGLLHVAIAIIGPWGYRFFGAGEEFAQADEAGALYPAVVTVCLAVVFVVFGIYACCPKIGRWRFPLRRFALWAIAVIYLLRGAAALVQGYQMAIGEPILMRNLIFSLVALGIGVCYLMGVLGLGKAENDAVRSAVGG